MSAKKAKTAAPKVRSSNKALDDALKASAKKPAAKTAKKPAAKKPASRKTTTDEQNAAFKLMLRENGASLKDFKEAGYNWPAMQVCKMAERNGFKVSSKKPDGEFKRYFATRP
jgi:hypothetical protein